MRKRLLNGVLIAVQAVLLAAALAAWWSHRCNTLFDNGRWIVGKDTGKYVFYAHDFLFQPLTGAGVELTSCMGFQEILYHRPEDDGRRLVGIECKALVSAGAYLWIEWRKTGRRMTACRLSRNDHFPGGFYRFDEDGEIVERVPMPELPRREPGEYRIGLRLEDGAWRVSVDGSALASIPDEGPSDGFFGFRGSGWNRRPVVLRRAVMTFADPARPGRTWTERERFATPRLRGGGLAVVAAFGAGVVLLRALRRRIFARWVLADRRGAFALADDAVFALALALALGIQLARAWPSGVAIPLALFAAECAGVVSYAWATWLGRRSRPTPGHEPSVGRGVPAEPEFPPATWIPYVVVLLALSVTASIRHGPWLGRKQQATRALRENVQLAALHVRPDTRHASESLAVENIVVAPGQPFFTEDKAYGAQTITTEFVMPPNSTLDVVFQQQQFATRGDPKGEEIPLQRRLLRLSTRPDVSAGVSRRTDNRPLPFTPVSGSVVPDTTNHLEIASGRTGLRVTLNGAASFPPGVKPIGYGETGFLAYEQPVVLPRIRIEPTAEERVRQAALPWLNAAFPLALALGTWLLLRTGGRVPLGGVALTEFAALFPLGFYFAASLFLPTAEFALLGRVRAAWFDLAVAGAAISQLHLLFAFGDRVRFKPLYANLFLLAAVGALTLFAWDVLPRDHPFRLRFAGDAVVPGDADAATLDQPGPWYNSNHKVGASTYIWKQRFGGREIGPKPAGVFRVFVVGGSQAWGSGAASSSETFSELLERRLRRRGLPVEVFNAAVNGGGIRPSLELYRDLLRGFDPDLLVADFGLNENTGLHRLRGDEDVRLHTGLQAGFLDELLRECEADGVGFVLVLEPMCSETPFQRIDSFYEALAETARRHNVPVLDPAPLFGEKESEHLVWWDSAHFAPYGQQLMAEFLEETAAAAVRDRL